MLLRDLTPFERADEQDSDEGDEQGVLDHTGPFLVSHDVTLEDGP